MTLKEFLALPHCFSWSGLGFSWNEPGGDNCMTFPASWMLAARGVDPAKGLRGISSTKDEAHAVIAKHGGALKLMASKFEATGCKRVNDPGDGDIGLIRMPDGDGFAEVGAIRFGPLWVCIGPGGVYGRRMDMVAAWRLPA